MRNGVLVMWQYVVLVTSRSFYTNYNEFTILEANKEVSVVPRQGDITNWY